LAYIWNTLVLKATRLKIALRNWSTFNNFEKGEKQQEEEKLDHVWTCLHCRQPAVWLKLKILISAGGSERSTRTTDNPRMEGNAEATSTKSARTEPENIEISGVRRRRRRPPDQWSSPSCHPSPYSRAAPFRSRPGGRRGGRPSPAAAAVPRTRPRWPPGGGSPPSSPPQQVLGCSAPWLCGFRSPGGTAHSDRFFALLGVAVGVGVAGGGGEAGAVSTSRRAVSTWRRPCTPLHDFSGLCQDLAKLGWDVCALFSCVWLIERAAQGVQDSLEWIHHAAQWPHVSPSFNGCSCWCHFLGNLVLFLSVSCISRAWIRVHNMSSWHLLILVSLKDEACQLSEYAKYLPKF